MSAQRVQCERAVVDLGLVLAEPHEYIRVGTGEEFSPELAQATADGRAGAFDVLVVAYSSRLGRSVREVENAKHALREAGVVVYIAEQRQISGTFANMLAEGVSQVVDAQANAERAVRVAGGLRERQQSGKWVGSIGYGFKKRVADNPDGTRTWDGTLEAEPAEAPIVRRIFSECLAGRSPADIALGLNAEALNNRGGPWRKSTIRKMLANPIYAGRMVRYRSTSAKHYFTESDGHDGRQSFDAPWAILVSANEWTAAQHVFPGRRPAMRPGRQYPLSGILKCGACGGRMQGAYNGKGDRYYRCGNRAESGTCQGPSVKATRVEDAFADWLSGFQLPVDWREAIARLRETPKPSGTKEAKLRTHLQRIKTLYADGDMEWPEYAAERDRTREKLAENVPVEPDTLERIAAVLAELGPLWRSDPTPALPAVLLDRAIVTDRHEVEFQPKASLRQLLEIASVGRSPRARSRRCATPSPPSSMTVTSSPSKASPTSSALRPGTRSSGSTGAT